MRSEHLWSGSRAAQLGALLTLLSVFLPELAQAKTILVSPTGDDRADGQSGPVKTVGKALQLARAGDELRFSAGVYPAAGVRYDVRFPVKLLGADPTTTIIEGLELQLGAGGLEIKGLGFRRSGTLIQLSGNAQNVIDGLRVCDSHFSEIERVIHLRNDNGTHVVRNVVIEGSRFTNLRGPRVGAVLLMAHTNERIRIRDNVAEGLVGQNNGSALAFVVGRNASRFRNNDILFERNFIRNIVAGTMETGQANEVPSGHGIWAFGSNIRVLNNSVIDINMAKDHEGIYLKAEGSIIEGNLVVDACGAGGGGCIAIKGSEDSKNNIVRHNTVLDRRGGHGLYLEGGLQVSHNYVHRTQGTGGNGITVFSWGHRVDITDNWAEGSSGIRLVHRVGGPPVDQGSVSRNVGIALASDGNPIRVNVTSAVPVTQNIECQGRAACMNRMPPNPSCINTGNRRCGSCDGAELNIYHSADALCCERCATPAPSSEIPVCSSAVSPMPPVDPEPPTDMGMSADMRPDMRPDMRADADMGMSVDQGVSIDQGGQPPVTDMGRSDMGRSDMGAAGQDDRDPSPSPRSLGAEDEGCAVATGARAPVTPLLASLLLGLGLLLRRARRPGLA